METLANVTVRQLIERVSPQRIPLNIALKLVLLAGEQLAQAHERHSGALLHGGLEPSRIHLALNGSVSLEGFGEAYASKRRLAYQAPELRRGEDPDVLADVYSLGAVLYELSTGFNLLQALTHEQSRGDDPAPRPTKFNPGLDDSIDEALLSALSHDPAERPYSVRSLLRTLQSILDELDLEPDESELAYFLHETFPSLEPSQPEASVSTAPEALVVNSPSATQAPVSTQTGKTETLPASATTQTQTQPKPSAPGSSSTTRRRAPIEVEEEEDPPQPASWTRELEPKLRAAWAQKNVRIATVVFGLFLAFLLLKPSRRDVLLTSVPSGATVILDGRTAGVTPLRLKSLSRNQHSIELQSSGFRPHTIDLDPSESTDLRVEVALERLASPPSQWTVKPAMAMREGSTTKVSTKSSARGRRR